LYGGFFNWAVLDFTKGENQVWLEVLSKKDEGVMVNPVQNDKDTLGLTIVELPSSAEYRSVKVEKAF